MQSVVSVSGNVRGVVALEILADLTRTANPLDGSRISVGGFHIKGDGGSGDFYWDVSRPKSSSGSSRIYVSRLFQNITDRD